MMIFIELTNENFTKFKLRADLIEQIDFGKMNGSKIRLASGRFVFCLEKPDEIIRIISGTQNPPKAPEKPHSKNG